MIAPGDSLGPYQVGARLGSGGMGEVFKAHDSRLGRDVALKVSHEAFTDRFTREARAIAALNHTNICHLYDVGPDYLVMEHVEGESLQGPMPFDEALPIINQLIDGIEAAHERNIIHRDLKPANIKITPDGVVKILDFGLAKALAPEGAGATTDLMNSPTVAPGLSATAQGTIVGTAAYMAPEQVRGKQADRRADIWAFGVIVYELLTGKRLFEGDTPVEILGQVLHKTPDLSAAPPRARRLLAWCLEPDRKDRLQAIGDARRLLREAPAELAQVIPAVTAARTWVWLNRASWVVAAIALAGLAGVAWFAGRMPRVEQPFMHLSIPMPGNAPPSFLALSPNGRMLVMLESGASLVVRSLDSNVVRPLAGTRLGRTPFWSPDSRTIAFFADNALKTISASGGPTQVLCSGTGVGGGGTWNRRGVILFATERGALKRVSAEGGECVDVTTADEAAGQAAFPMFLPDGEHFLYVKVTDTPETSGLFVASLDDVKGRRLLADRSTGDFVAASPTSSAGHLLFAREGNLMAQAFDATSLALSGEPFVVAAEVGFTSTRPQIAASASGVGTIVFLENGNPVRQLIWYDRSGKETGRPAETGSLGTGVSLAPDGRSVGFMRGDGQTPYEARVLDLERNQESRLPIGSPLVWSPDSSRVAFRAVIDGTPGLYVRAANGGVPELLLRSDDDRVTPSDWSRDGRYIAYTEIGRETLGDIWLLPVSTSPGAPVPLVRTNNDESQGAISPGQKWLAYTSTESATAGVYLRRLDANMRVSDATLTVSTAAAAEPRWRADGKELFYLERIIGSRRYKLFAVPFNETSDNPLGLPRQLFEFTSVMTAIQANAFAYSPSADGQRFLVNAYSADAQSSLDVLINWPASLR